MVFFDSRRFWHKSSDLKLWLVSRMPWLARLYRGEPSDVNGESWGSPVTVSGVRADWLQMVMVNGHPAIAWPYRIPESDTHVLKCVRKLDADGNAWREPLLIVDGEVGQRRPSLPVDRGSPAIACVWRHGGHCEHLKYVKATDPDGSNWRYPVILDEVNFGYPPLKLANGGPAISYLGGQRQLRFAIYCQRAKDPLFLAARTALMTRLAVARGLEFFQRAA